VNYYCTCSENPKKDNAVRNGRTPFREVSADSEGICLNCGHYAVAYFEKIDADEGNLYRILYDEREEWKPERVEGGSSLRSEYKIEKRKRGMSESSGENKDGNLDV